MWALHETHSDDYKFDPTKKWGKEKKKVTFVTDTVPDDKSKEPVIKVNKNLLTNAKAYLAQFQDFQVGGSQD